MRRTFSWKETISQVPCLNYLCWLITRTWLPWLLFFSKECMFIESLQPQATKSNFPNTRHKTFHRIGHSGASNTFVGKQNVWPQYTWYLLSDLSFFCTVLSLCVLFFLSRIKEGRGSHRTAGTLFSEVPWKCYTSKLWQQDTPWRKSALNLHKKTETKTACDTSYIPRKNCPTSNSHVEIHRTVLWDTT